MRLSADHDRTVTGGGLAAEQGDVAEAEVERALLGVGADSLLAGADDGRVPAHRHGRAKEITGRAGMHEAKVGDRIEVYVERLEDRHGEAMLSVEKARREASWNLLEDALVTGAHIDGIIFGRVKGGFAVEAVGGHAEYS